jgi:hypothetical protein
MKIFKQETNRSCGIACLRSIFNYYGKELAEKDIFEKHEFYSKENTVANPLISLGVTALKFGFKADYIGYNPIIAKDSERLEESLENKSKTYFGIGKFYVDSTLEFLKLGGKVKIERLNSGKLENLIDRHKFILIGIKPAFLDSKAPPHLSHKILLDGYNKKTFHVLDPADGKARNISKGNLLMAFYADMPEALIIRK